MEYNCDIDPLVDVTSDTPRCRCSMTTLNMAGIFSISLLLFIFSVAANMPQMFHTNGTSFWDRISRDGANLTQKLTYGSSYPFSNGHKSDNDVFIFKSMPYSTSSDPFRDCRYKQAAAFGRKRQLVLVDRNQFDLEPDSSLFEHLSLPANKTLPRVTRFLVIFIAPTTPSFRKTVRHWVANENIQNEDRFLKCLFFVYNEENSSRLGLMKSELEEFNDILVSKFENYPITRSLSWICDYDINLVSSYELFLFIGDVDKAPSDYFFHKIQFLHDQILSQNDKEVVDEWPREDVNLFGGLACFDYQSVPSDRDFTSFSCYMDAFFCSSSLLVMTSQLAETISDTSWNTPLLEQESRYLGLSLEFSEVEFTSVVLETYTVGSFSRNQNPNRSMNKWLQTLN